MSARNTSGKVSLAFIALSFVLLGAACSKQSNQNKNTNNTLGQVTVPAPGDKGIFIGKLDTLALGPNDLPAQYRPYEKNHLSSGSYSNVDNQKSSYLYKDQLYDSVVTQTYNAQRYDGSTGFGVSEIFKTFSDTGASVDNYNNLKLFAADSGIDGTFSGLGDDNYYDLSTFGQAPGSTPLKMWTINVLKSNLNATLYITIDATKTADDVKTAAIDPWLAKVAAYKPGTASDIQAENSSAPNLNINISE